MLDGSEGLFLSLLTESYAVRALLGSLAAVCLAMLAVSTGLVRSSRARRLLILGPVLVAVAAVITATRAQTGYLPRLTRGDGLLTASSEALQSLGAAGVGVNLLLVVYATVVGALLLRRVLGVIAVRRLLRRATRAAPTGGLARMTRAIARRMHIRQPRVLLLERCPGGAFTIGTWRPLIAIDPLLLRQLDDRELQGLLAHELAHIRRRDNLLWLGVGIARDLSFFLPPMHLAARWLRLEQEESADELASKHTRRPVALASSILKVWDCSKDHGGLRAACAAVGYHRGRFALATMSPPVPAVASGPSAAPLPLGTAARAITLRIERLISAPTVIGLWRRRAEMALALAVVGTAATAAVAVPSWVGTAYPELRVVYQPPAEPAEAPAWQTFRTLAPAAAAQSADAGAAESSRFSRADQSLGCPCIESQAQLRRGIQATAPQQLSAMQWVRGNANTWEFNNAVAELAPTSTRQMQQVLGGNSSQLGLFLVTAPAS